jgi:Zn-dependent peptidase ImmA (M78 family)
MYFSEWRKIQKQIEEKYVVEEMTKKQFEDIVQKFLPFAKEFLKLKKLPEIHFVEKPAFAKKISAFGQISDDRIVVDIKDRQPMDILRTISHELVHYSQHQKGIKGSSAAGSSTENQANKLAGSLIRKFGETHSKYFELSAVMEAKKKRKRRNMIDIDSEHYPIELS